MWNINDSTKWRGCSSHLVEPLHVEGSCQHLYVLLGVDIAVLGVDIAVLDIAILGVDIAILGVDIAVLGAVVPNDCVAARAVETAEVAGASGCVAAETSKVAGLA